MKIAYLAAGSAGMYCGSCLHDNTLAAALIQLGEDVVLVPIYTPIRTDERDVSQRRVFIGGINAYLQQKIRLFRHTPAWLDRIWDHPALLRLLAGQGASVDPEKLGGMTVSMLQGELGNQRKELDRLVDWLINEVQPDIVHLSNSMMLGLARKITERCGPPIVCSLSGEDIFLEKIRPPYYVRTRQLLRERAAEIQAFVALNEYYANFMSEYLSIGREQVHVIPHGLNLEGHGSPHKKSTEGPQRIGYLARICKDKGLHLLLEACEILIQEHGCTNIEVHAAGYLGAGDRGYFQHIQRRVDQGPLAKKFQYHGELDRDNKIAFLQSLDIFSTPTLYPESKGLPLLEAWANAIPAVVPGHGAFTELVADTEGGILFEPHNPEDLAKCLAELLENRDRANHLGKLGQVAILDRYHSKIMAQRTKEFYEKISL